MLRLIILLLLLPATLVSAKPAWLTKPTQHSEAGWQIERLAAGLTDGWGLAQLPDSRLLVSSRTKGIVWLLDQKAGTIEPLITLTNVYTRGQGGLLGLWVDADFARQPFVYLAKSTELNGKNTTQLLRYRFSENQLTDERVLFTALPWVNNNGHFGGAIAQDNKGFIYLSIGDRRQMDKPQALDNHLGKIVKLNRDGEAADAAIADNALAEIYSYGHRNPQGLVYHNGILWSAEHGPQGGDEVNQVEQGKNYGWPVITYGEQYGGGKIGEGKAKAGMEQPVFYYVPSIATSDMLALTANEKTTLYVASLKAGLISQLQYDGKNWQEHQRLLARLKERWRSIKADGTGGFYLLAESGNFYRVVPVNQ